MIASGGLGLMPVFYAVLVVVTLQNNNSPGKGHMDFLLADAFSVLLVQDWTRKVFADTAKGFIYKCSGFTLSIASDATKQFHADNKGDYLVIIRSSTTTPQQLFCLQQLHRFSRQRFLWRALFCCRKRKEVARRSMQELCQWAQELPVRRLTRR